MIKNYIKTAMRNLWKGRVFNGMNLVGLSVAIACCTLLFLTIYFEFSFDGFHKNLPDIYQTYFTVNRAEKAEKGTAMPVPLGPALKTDYQDIQYISRMGNGGSVVRVGDKQIGQSIHFVDPDFLKIFTFQIIKGNEASPLKNLNDVVITEYSAKAIFNSIDVVGKTIELNLTGTPQTFVVTGVTKDFPQNSSIQFDMLLRMENMPGYQGMLSQWNNQNHLVYMKLNPNVDRANFEKRLQAFVKKHYAEQIKEVKRDGARPDVDGNIMSLNLLPFGDTHFNTELGGLEGQSTSKSAVISLMVIGIFILLIACINFINLSVARSFTRAREVGVRKTLGASKWQLVSQFWVETVLVCFAALVLGLVLATLTLESFKASLKTNITLSMLLQPGPLAGMLGIFILITLVAGFYPALLMQRFKTVQVLKGTVNSVKPGKVRNILLVVQFSISTLLIVCTLITWQQTDYMQKQPLGYNKTEVMSIPIARGQDGNQALQLFRHQLNGDPNVIALSGCYDNLGMGNDGSMRTSVTGFTYKGHEVRTTIQKVDFDYLKTLDIKLTDGRDFSREFATDSNAVVINEQMARQINASGKAVDLSLPMNEIHSRVIGVFKSYNFRSLRTQIEPLTLVLDKNYPINYILIKVKPGSLIQSMDDITQKWKATFPTVDFKGSWLSENTEKQYRKEKRLATIFITSAIIAILISCIGLVAISVMIMVQRTKEIGIRKVLGSSVTNIVLLLSADFVKLVGLAALISFPIGWWLMHKWLESYAYRIDIQWWVFLIAGVMAVAIAFITISFQSIRAALINPVKSLKSE
ncbi:ABC transporter permease [Mucilaginibacter myungsuensis]|uniref:ABC transporter permease n=1 Tax=Mucilaginibacter myungsuensis TaxID=649104 RepID=A0A929PW05_9SPHI|nr:ABC transporter permease [Mucilaginibacter myungsuensis]MBE9660652.1 ABC transporter permease [Mucilaginibacter myungsuensis]MDN3600697.1 ABC transporter permease [Mucilaginibacter myungsuensis]